MNLITGYTFMKNAFTEDLICHSHNILRRLIYAYMHIINPYFTGFMRWKSTTLSLYIHVTQHCLHSTACIRKVCSIYLSFYGVYKKCISCLFFSYTIIRLKFGFAYTKYTVMQPYSIFRQSLDWNWSSIYATQELFLGQACNVVHRI